MQVGGPAGVRLMAEEILFSFFGRFDFVCLFVCLFVSLTYWLVSVYSYCCCFHIPNENAQEKPKAK